MVTIIVGTVSLCLNMIIRLVRNEIKKTSRIRVWTGEEELQAMKIVSTPVKPVTHRKRRPKLNEGEIPCPDCGKAVSKSPIRVEASSLGNVAIHGCGKCGEVKIPLQVPEPSA